MPRARSASPSARCARASPASAATLPSSSLQDRREGLRRVGGRALGEHLLGRGQRLLEPGVAARHRDQPVDERLDLRRRLRPHEAVDRLAADEAEDRRDRLHPHLRRDPLVLVDVDLDQPHLALGLGDRLLQRRRQRLARPAPGRPEVDDHRHLARGLDHVGHEGRLGPVLDRARRRGLQVHRGASPGVKRLRLRWDSLPRASSAIRPHQRQRSSGRAAKAGSRVTSGIAIVSPVAASRRSKGSRCSHGIVAASRQISGVTGALSPPCSRRIRGAAAGVARSRATARSAPSGRSRRS